MGVLGYYHVWYGGGLILMWGIFWTWLNHVMRSLWNLNGKYKISAPHNSVSVMALISNHHLKTCSEVVEMVSYHAEAKCKCGVVSRGTIRDFGYNLYNAQIREWGEYKFTVRECLDWMYALFTTQSLRGSSIEHDAIDGLARVFPDYGIAHSTTHEDEEFSVDIIVNRDSKRLCAVQVKAESYKNIPDDVKKLDTIKNLGIVVPVFYLYYNKSGKFINSDEIVENIKDLG